MKTVVTLKTIKQYIVLMKFDSTEMILIRIEIIS